MSLLAIIMAQVFRETRIDCLLKLLDCRIYIAQLENLMHNANKLDSETAPGGMCLSSSLSLTGSISSFLVQNKTGYENETKGFYNAVTGEPQFFDVVSTVLLQLSSTKISLKVCSSV